MRTTVFIPLNNLGREVCHFKLRLTCIYYQIQLVNWELTSNSGYQSQYCPQIQSIEEKYDTQITQALAAQSAQARLETALTDKQTAGNTASVGIPIFGILGYLLSGDGKTTEQAEHDAYMAFVIITAVVTELLSSVLFVAANVFGKNVRPTFEQIRQVRLAELEIHQELEALQDLNQHPALAATYPKP